MSAFEEGYIAMAVTPNAVQILKSNVAGNRPPAGRSPGELYVNWADAQLGSVNGSSANQDLIAVRYFSTTANYAIGDHVIQGGKLYRAIAASTAGAFVPANWVALASMSDLTSAAFLPLIGGTLTGTLNINVATAVNSLVITPTAVIGANIVLNKTTAGQSSNIWSQFAGSNRWDLTIGDGTSESGSNAGSNFNLSSYSDTGVLLGSPLSILRANGYVNINGIGSAINSTSAANPVGNATISLNKATATNGVSILSSTNGSLRWQIAMGGATPESGSNAGSDFGIAAFSDSGAVLCAPMSIWRATATVVFNAVGSTAYSGSASVGDSNVMLNKAGSTHQSRLFGLNNGAFRWAINLGSQVAESGSNAGSDFNISNYTDAGTVIGSPITIQRNIGAIAFNGNGAAPFASGAASGTCVVTLNKAASGLGCSFGGTTNGILRWVLNLSDGTAETGSNVGSNFSINNVNDSGGNFGPAFSIERATGYTTVSANGATQPAASAAVAPAFASFKINKAGSGASSMLSGYNNGLCRWNIHLGEGTPETGGNAGSNFAIVNFNDAGASIATPLSINRANSQATFAVAIINGSSDRRLKENITPIEGALDKVLALQGVEFNFITTPEKQEIGLIAQDVVPVVPEVVQVYTPGVSHLEVEPLEEPEPMMALDYPKLTALLIEAVKTLTARVETLETALSSK